MKLACRFCGGVSLLTLIPVLALLIGGGAAPISRSANVSMTKRDNTIDIAIGGELFTTLRFGSELPKPYFYPVIGPGGKHVTRKTPVEAGEDHPHQKSLWIAIDQVNDVDFWAEKGKIVNRSVTLVNPMGDPAVLREVNDWQDMSGNTVVTETTTVSVSSNRMIRFDTEFAAGKSAVTFGDTKEGLLGVRVNPELREDKGTGKISNADGSETEKNCWSKESAWVDYSGKVEGVPLGVAIFDHPTNFRRSRWHVRGYGLFSVNPFGGKAYTGDAANVGTTKLEPGKSLMLRYAVYVHEGDRTQGKVGETYQRYAASR